MGKYMGNVPRLLDINAKCTDVKFPDARGRQGQRKTKVIDVRGTVELVMLPEMEDPHPAFFHRPRTERGTRF